MKDLSIIIVNYKSSQLLRNCLNSLTRIKFRGSWEVIVIDNGSSDAGWEDLKKDFSKVQFYELLDNRGFSAGNNAGIRKSEGKTVLLLNPDTEIEHFSIQAMYDCLMEDPQIGVVGPKIFYNDGTLQVRFIPKRIPKLRHLFFELFYLDKLFPKNKFFNDYFGADFDYEKAQDVEQVSGACFLIRRDVIEKIGFMDERFFLYFDETDWSARVLRAGYRIRYLPKAEVLHLEGKSGGGENKFAIFAFYESELFFFLKYYKQKVMTMLYLINIVGLVYRLAFSWYYLLIGKYQKPKRFWYGLLVHLNILTYFKILQLSHKPLLVCDP